MPFFAQLVVTWYEPPALAELYRRVPVYDHPRRALLVLLVLLLAVLGPPPLFRTWVLPPNTSYMPWYEGYGFALVLWTPFALLYRVVAWVERRGVRRRILMRWNAQGRRCWLSMGITRLPCTVLQEYVPVHIALDDYDAVTLVNTPHVSGIMYYLWQGSTARRTWCCKTTAAPR